MLGYGIQFFNGRLHVVCAPSGNGLRHNLYTEQVWKMAKAKGFKGIRSLFWFAIRNPIYCGKIFIPKHKDEESQFVKGQHDPIISESLFYEVQDVLDGKGRHYRLKMVATVSLPLRGYLLPGLWQGIEWKRLQGKV